MRVDVSVAIVLQRSIARLSTTCFTQRSPTTSHTYLLFHTMSDLSPSTHHRHYRIVPRLIKSKNTSTRQHNLPNSNLPQYLCSIHFPKRVLPPLLSRSHLLPHFTPHHPSPPRHIHSWQPTPLPSAAEHTRLLDQHNALVAPVENRIVHVSLTHSPRSILEVGCGTGVIARYLFTHYPSATHVYGIDLSPNPPSPHDTSQRKLELIQGNFRTLAGKDERLKFGSMDSV